VLNCRGAARRAIVMTILPFVRPETTFDPDAVAIMSSAFDAALASLNDQNQSPTIREIIAKRIIAAAMKGERDPERLRQEAINAISRIAE
jgi:hypothetical protein